MSFLSKLAEEQFPHPPADVRAALLSCNYNKKKAAKELNINPDTLWDFINGPVYMRYMREEAHVALLKMLEKSSVETPKNIAALCEIRDNAEKDRERIMAVKALEDIFAQYKLPAAPVEASQPADVEERRRAAYERVSEALRNAGPPELRVCED